MSNCFPRGREVTRERPNIQQPNHTTIAFFSATIYPTNTLHTLPLPSSLPQTLPTPFSISNALSLLLPLPSPTILHTSFNSICYLSNNPPRNPHPPLPHITCHSSLTILNHFLSSNNPAELITSLNNLTLS